MIASRPGMLLVSSARITVPESLYGARLRWQFDTNWCQTVAVVLAGPGISRFPVREGRRA